MNLIKNFWAHLKLELHRRYSNTATLSGSPEYIRRRIIERVHEVWWTIKEEALKRLIDSMPILYPTIKMSGVEQGFLCSLLNEPSQICLAHE